MKLLSFLLCWFLLSSSYYVGLPVTYAGLGFCRVWLPLDQVSAALSLHLLRKHSWASAVLGFRLAEVQWRLLQPGYIRVMALDVLGECVISLVQSQCNKYVSGGPVLQLGCSPEFYLIKDNTPLRHEGGRTLKERPQPFLK